MKVIKFKTSLKCGGCVNAIRPYLNKISAITSWEVDLSSPERTLIVQTELDSLTSLEDEINTAFKSAGYKSELI
ncbi:MAG: cation transporter [Bacteroidales bacterium]|jgi:copper chaperone|nr:cation transporter [Bacteroidales bacterium]